MADLCHDVRSELAGHNMDVRGEVAAARVDLGDLRQEIRGLWVAVCVNTGLLVLFGGLIVAALIVART